jgi:uncharacterized protein involved in exopolysaccharide biosynthesis
MIQSGETLPDLLLQIWRARLAVLTGLLVGLVVSAIFFFSVTPRYEAFMIVAPVKSGLAQDQFPGIGFWGEGAFPSSAVSVRQDTPPEFVRFEQILRGASVAAALLKQEDIQDRLAEDPCYRGFDGGPSGLSGYLRDKISIMRVGASSSLKITYRHPDRDFAAELLKDIHAIADESLRRRSREDGAKRIGWLQDRLKQTFNPDHRAALTALLMAEERGQMLALMDISYAADLVEPPATLPRPVFPNPFLVFPVGGFAGMLIGFLVFTLRRAARV